MKLLKKFWNDKDDVKAMNELKARCEEKCVMCDIDDCGEHYDFFISEHDLNQLSESEVTYIYFGKAE